MKAIGFGAVADAMTSIVASIGFISKLFAEASRRNLKIARSDSPIERLN